MEVVDFELEDDNLLDEDNTVDVDNPSPSLSPRSLVAFFSSLSVVPSKEGEVYSLEINYILMILYVLVILIFGDGKESEMILVLLLV